MLGVDGGVIRRFRFKGSFNWFPCVKTHLYHQLTVKQPIVVSPTTADPVLTLISGITSNSDDYYRYFSYSELKTLAMDDSSTGSATRTALFGDQKYNPSQWSSLTREALLLLGNDYQLLLRRGGPAPTGKHTYSLVFFHIC